MESETKKVKTTKGQASQEDFLRDQDVVPTPKDESFTEKALRNGLILQKIFANVSTSLILSSCSLVNTTWNAEARTFVRDHRICTAANKKTTSACKFLQEFEKLCDQMTRNGRVIPFNCLRLHFNPRSNVVCCYNENIYSSLTSSTEFKLKYLEMFKSRSQADSDDHECYKPLRALLQRKSYELKSLKTDKISLTEDLFCVDDDDWDPEIPQLEKLDIADIVEIGVVFDRPESEPETNGKETIRRLLKRSASLNAIAIRYLATIRIVPEEILANVKLNLDDGFHVWLHDEMDVDLLDLVSDRGSGLSTLHVTSSPSFNWAEFGDQNELRRFETALQRMLQKNHGTLRCIELHGPYPLSRLSYPPLFKLSRFTITKGTMPRLLWLWNALVSMNFERDMPNLEEVKICPLTENRRPHVQGNVFNAWPPAADSNALALHCCTTVLKLELELDFQEINLGPLRALFPNVVHLSFTTRNRKTDERDFALLQQIWESWPQLEVLEFSVENRRSRHPKVTHPKRNYDMDLLGVHEEEVKFLMRQDDDYLRQVHIVPIKPSLLTMPKLRTLRLHDSFFNGQKVKLISKVTKLVAFTKICEAKVYWPNSDGY